MAAQNAEPETAVRLVRGTIEGREDPVIPGAWIVERVDEQALAEGRIWPQSRGSQLVGHSVGSKPERAHARPLRGARRQGDDARRARSSRSRSTRRGPRSLRRRRSRLRATGVRVVRRGRPRAAARSSTGFDRALVDAPCSGLGVLASRPDLRWRAEPLPELQLELLRSAIGRVRPGGTVVYSTARSTREECEDVVDAVVADGEVEVDASLGEDWPAFRHRTRPELPPDAAARPRDERLLRRPADPDLTPEVRQQGTGPSP